MKYFLFSLYTIVATIQLKQSVEGIYYSIGNKFEKYSKIILKQDGKFIYSAGVGGCQVEVTGKWRAEGNRLYLINDIQFLSNANDTSYLAPFYPDMSLIKWKINANALKPLRQVDSGCVVDGRKHVRVR